MPSIKFDSTDPLNFLSKTTTSDRRIAMRRDVVNALNRRAIRRALRLLWQGISRPLSRSSQSDLKDIQFQEWAYQVVDEWTSLDASSKLAAALKQKRPFVLYLRAFRQADFRPDPEKAKDHWDKNEGVVFSRSIENGNLSPIRESERLKLFGLCNVMDMNLLPKYEPIWLPPSIVPHWVDVVVALAEASEFVVLDATGIGTGLYIELDRMAKTFPGKCWLIAGIKSNDDFVSQEV
jgi:hypothetical protein